MYLEIEQSGRNRRLINTTLIDKVELDDTTETAQLWIGGSLITASRIAYQFYANRPNELVTVVPPPPPLQVGTPPKEK